MSFSEYDVFVSYRRDGGSELARFIKRELEQDHFSVFLDVDELQTGRFDTKLLDTIARCPNYLVILTPESLERCRDENDWLRREIEAAIQAGATIIPITTVDFVFPAETEVPESIKELLHLNAVDYAHNYAEASLSRIRNHLTTSKTRELKNKQFLLAGNLSSSHFTFSALFPRWITLFLFRIWPATLILQWLICLPIAFSSGTMFSVTPTAEFRHTERAISTHALASDYFFIWWNLGPLVLLFLAARLQQQIRPKISQFFELDVAAEKERNWQTISDSNNKWAQILSSRYTLCFAAIFAAGTVIFQCLKLDQLLLTDAYWWDWRISRAAFVVRAAALFVDWIGLIYFFGLVCALVHVLSMVLQSVEFRVDSNHSDGVNGLRVVGDTTLLFAPFFIVISFNANVAMLDHQRQSMHFVSDVVALLIGCTAFFGVLFLNLQPAYRQITRHLNRQITVRCESREKLYIWFSDLLSRELQHRKDLEDYQAAHAAIQTLAAEERRLSKCRRWPIGRRKLLCYTILGLTPALLACCL